MDPLSAFSLACNVLQIVDLGRKVILRAREIYKDGATSENIALEETTTSLALASDKMQKALQKAPKPLTEDEQETLDIAAKCLGTSKELLTKLEELKPSAHRRKRQALTFGLWTAWEKDVVNDIQQKLDQYRKVFATRVLISLRYVGMVRHERTLSFRGSPLRGLSHQGELAH